MISYWFLPFVLLYIPSDVFAITEQKPFRQSINLHRRTHTPRSTEEWGIWAKNHRDNLSTKYGSSGVQKRSSGTNLITNQNGDSSYYGSLAIGTPPVSYNIILDTGSADLWIAGSDCQSGCNGLSTFNSSASSSYKTMSTSFSITYGSGKVSGSLGQDVVQMAGFSVTNQIFGVCNVLSSGMLNSPISGLLGLAFQSIASSDATPFWQSLVAGGAWDSPVMSFQLSRYVNDSSASPLEPGGSFTMGFVNSSLYSGDIEYINMPSQGTYWILPMTSLTVQGNSISLPSGSDSYAAIDTGTTSVGGPAQSIADIFAQIPGSAPGTGNFDGYYTYPCDNAINITISFGGKSWSINPSDFKLSEISDNMCLGAFFHISTGNSAPSWIIGDTFLKNVYSVFRYDPPSIGFAALAGIVVAQDGVDGVVPSATVGSAAATVSATGGVQPDQSSTSLPTFSISAVPLFAFVMFWSTVLVGRGMI